MRFMIHFFFLCVVILQLTIHVTSTASVERNLDNVIRRIPFARRVQAPLMGRSISITSNDPSRIENDDENQSFQLNKRGFGSTLLDRRRWMGLKRRGPLLG